MSHVYHLFFVFVFVVFSVHSNCSEIWGLSTPNTIEQWDTSGLYNYPDQTRWLSQLLCIQLWCGRVVISVGGDGRWEHLCFSSIHQPLPPLPGHLMCLPAPTPCTNCLTTISCLLFNQISGWPPAGVPQEGPSPRYLLPPVAMAGPSQPPRAACHWGLWVCLPPQEGWSLHQPLPLPEGGDPRWGKPVQRAFVSENVLHDCFITAV